MMTCKMAEWNVIVVDYISTHTSLINMKTKRHLKRGDNKNSLTFFTPLIYRDSTDSAVH